MGMRATLYAISPEAHARARAGDPDFETTDSLDLDKAWHAIHVLLTGDTELRFLADGDTVVDEGDCLVAVHDSGSVARLRDTLAHMPPAGLMLKFDPDRFTAAEIYPGPWDATAGPYLLRHLERLAGFIADAAARGRALAVVLA